MGRDAEATTAPAAAASTPLHATTWQIEVNGIQQNGHNGVCVRWRSAGAATRIRIDVVGADGMRARRVRVDATVGEVRIGKLDDTPQPLTIVASASAEGGRSLAAARATLYLAGGPR